MTDHSLISADTLPVAQQDVNKPAPEHIMQFFAYLHLSAHLQEVSRPFCELAKTLVDPAGAALPRNPERTVALRKLLEAKDAAVRAATAK